MKQSASPRPHRAGFPNSVIDRQRALAEARRAQALAEEEPRFSAREGEGTRRFQVYDATLDKVVKRLGSLARSEEEAGIANEEQA